MSKDDLTQGGTALSGALAGMFAVTMSYPFDLIKTRTQFLAAEAGAPVGISQVTKTIYAEGAATGGPLKGFLAYYRGLDQLLPEAAFKTMLRFFVFKDLKARYVKEMGLDEMTIGGNMVCGAVAGAVETTLIVQPFERGKTLKAAFKKPFEVYGALYRSSGALAALRSMYAGYLPCLGRQVGNQATAFTVFYTMKKEVEKSNGGAKLGVLQNMGMGFLAGASACCVTMPMDVAKSIAQKQTGETVGMATIMKNVVASKGIKGLYSGIGPRIGRVGLDRAFGFLAFEWISEKLVTYDTFNIHSTA